MSAVEPRAAYRDIELYEPGRVPVDVDLSDNTNLFGVAPAARRLLATLPDAMVTRYPSVFSTALKRALADRHGVRPENVVTGCGSDDVIDSTVRAFCEPGERVAFPVPTFGVVRTFALMNATTPVPVPARVDFSIDADALVAANARVTYVCSPNNPTGTATPRETIAALDAGLHGLLVLDEAYADYAGSDHGAFVATSARTVSLRTFSKAFGLAGLRVGYALGPAVLVHEIEKSRGPYKVSAVAEAVALRVLAEDDGWVQDMVARTLELRERLAQRLAAMQLRIWPSAGNFLLVQLPAGMRALDANQALRAHGVAVRPFSDLPHAGECLRVTVGPWRMMERFLEALAIVLADADS